VKLSWRPAVALRKRWHKRRIHKERNNRYFQEKVLLHTAFFLSVLYYSEIGVLHVPATERVQPTTRFISIEASK